MVDESEVKMPWDSKTEIAATIGLIITALSALGITGIQVTVEQISAISALIFIIVMIARKYGGGIIVMTQGAKAEKIAELEAKCK
jgi:hypothetical protein